MTYYYTKPVNAPTYSGSWGKYPVSGRTHRAVDYAVAYRDFRCAGAGLVVVSGWSSTGFGYHIRVRLDNGQTVIYGHLSKRYVSKGQRVRRGQVLGRTGNSGNSTGPHLHMEVRRSCYEPLTSWNFTPYLRNYVP
jgi:murein DD-endopeptidase MepM/ murein hydrolase activator NlpD